MLNKIAIAFYLLCCCLLSPLFGDVLQYEDQIIEKITVDMHAPIGSACDSKAILNRMTTYEGGLFSQVTFDEDLKILSQEYDRVEPTVESKDGKIEIILNIWPKPTIRTITWCGIDRIEGRRLRRELDIQPLSVFERQTFNTAFHKIKAYYIRKGFFEVQVDYRIEPVCDSNEVDIIIEVVEGRAGHIKEINFVNFTECEENELLDQLITKKYNIFLSWFNQTGTYNEEAIQQDQLVAINYLQNEGYADAQVRIDVEDVGCDRIVVTFTADRGELYYFGALSFEGNTLLCDDEIDALFTVRPGQYFSMDEIRTTVDLITNAYGKLGYIDTIVDFEPQLCEDRHVYDVKFTIEEGVQSRVGMVRVFGNTTTKTTVILHETLMIPGEIFNSLKMKATEMRLKNIGYFSNVNVYVVKGTQLLGDDNHYRDVYIEVEETSTGQFGASMGYSTVDELFGSINITENNFNHEGFYYLHRDGLRALRGGGEFLSMTATVGQKSRSYVVSWTKPYFMDTKWSVGVDLSNSIARYISNEYDLETTQINLRAQYPINQFIRAGVHYRLTNGAVFLHNMHEEARHHRQAVNELERESHIHGLISAVGCSLTYDSTNAGPKTYKGFRSKLGAEFAGVGGDHTFINFNYLNSYYYPVGSRMVIKYRADWRFLQPVGSTHYATIPLEERFFLGGDFPVRGFRPYRIGPQYTNSHIPRGGLSLQLYSVEMTRRLFKDFETFIFFDAGHLSKNTWDFGRLSCSIGYGAKFKLIASIPEVALGMGYPLNARDNSEVKKFFISLGGSF